MVKNIYCTIKYTCCSLMMSMAVTVGVAQEKIADRLNTPAALENMKMRGLWSQSKNAAGADIVNYAFNTIYNCFARTAAFSPNGADTKIRFRLAEYRYALQR